MSVSVLARQWWELDSDHDFLVSKNDLLRYGNHSLTYRIVERIFTQVRPAYLCALRKQEVPNQVYLSWLVTVARLRANLFIALTVALQLQRDYNCISPCTPQSMECSACQHVCALLSAGGAAVREQGRGEDGLRGLRVVHPERGGQN